MVLQILHIEHFSIQRMKQLARTAVYWPNIDCDIAELCHHFTSCNEQQNQPAKAPNHPWMQPSRPWSRTTRRSRYSLPGQHLASGYRCIFKVPVNPSDEF